MRPTGMHSSAAMAIGPKANMLISLRDDEFVRFLQSGRGPRLSVPGLIRRTLDADCDDPLVWLRIRRDNARLGLRLPVAARPAAAALADAVRPRHSHRSFGLYR